MPFPPGNLIDNFNRTENPLSNGGLWVTPPGADGSLQANGSSLTGTTTTLPSDIGQMAYLTTDFGPDVMVAIDIVTKPDDGSGNLALFLRLQNIGLGTINGYSVDAPRCRAGADEWRLEVFTNSTKATNATIFTQEVAAGDSVGASIVGNIITAWYKPAAGLWRVVGSWTDSTYPATGKVGVGPNYNTTQGFYDNFYAQSYRSAGASVNGGISLRPRAFAPGLAR